ncbi:hypothetical protein Avbf_02788 [Armadillidium vulgare]|nr:hypothetical protein Avbf_02788 [Armadillidium vulgare]
MLDISEALSAGFTTKLTIEKKRGKVFLLKNHLLHLTPAPAPASSSSHKPSKHQSKELSPRHSKRPLETNDKPGPKSSKLPRSEPQRSRERGSGFEKEKDRDVHPRSDRENFRGVREPNKERSREPRGRKSPSPVHRRRLSPSPRNRSRDSPRKKSRTRSPTRNLVILYFSKL